MDKKYLITILILFLLTGCSNNLKSHFLFSYDPQTENITYNEFFIATDLDQFGVYDLTYDLEGNMYLFTANPQHQGFRNNSRFFRYDLKNNKMIYLDDELLEKKTFLGIFNKTLHDELFKYFYNIIIGNDGRIYFPLKYELTNLAELSRYDPKTNQFEFLNKLFDGYLAKDEGGVLYGGTGNTMFAYDTKSNQFLFNKTKPIIKSPFVGIGNWLIRFVSNNKYVFGDIKNIIFQYDPTKKEIIEIGDPGFGTDNDTGTNSFNYISVIILVSNEIYGIQSETFFKYDIDSGKFTPIRRISYSDGEVTAMILGPDNKIYIAISQRKMKPSLTEVEGQKFIKLVSVKNRSNLAGHFLVYDPQEDSLTDKGQLIKNRYYIGFLKVGDNKKIYGSILTNWKEDEIPIFPYILIFVLLIFFIFTGRLDIKRKELVILNLKKMELQKVNLNLILIGFIFGIFVAFVINSMVYFSGLNIYTRIFLILIIPLLFVSIIAEGYKIFHAILLSCLFGVFLLLNTILGEIKSLIIIISLTVILIVVKRYYEKGKISL